MTVTNHRDDHVSDAHQARIRAWTTQLYREYDSLLFYYRLNLRKPVLAIEPMSGRWGSWDPVTRNLRLSEALLERYSWDVVIEVLKHEVAHQIVSELFHGDNPAHDAQFRTACNLLGMTDWGARATGDLPDRAPRWSGRSLSAEEERLLARADKLLALAASSNEHEAALAMQRVHELYARHNIEQAWRGAEPEVVYTIIGRKRRRMESTESTILAILVEHFYVEAIHIRRYDAADQVEYRVAEVIGTPANVAMAEYVYAFLWRTIQTLWRDYQSSRSASSRGSSVRARRSYQLGVLTGFNRKLAEDNSIERVTRDLGLDAAQSKALVARRDGAVDRFVGGRHPRLATRRFAGGRFDRESFSAGIEDGRQVTLRKGIEEKKGNRGRFLGDGQ